jgi:hypothetical protein
MSAEAVRVDQPHAQRLFEALPEAMQIPTLSPAYVAADARRDPALSPCWLVWSHGSAWLMHSLHEARIPGRAESDWQSPYGYGGPLDAGLGAGDVARAWQAFDALARERRIVVEFVRFHPLLANERGYPGTVQPDRSVAMLDLSPGDLLARYSGRARTAVRKALKGGLQLRWEASADAQARFPAFYRAGMAQIGADAFYRFDDGYFAALLSMPAARVLSVIGADGDTLSMGLFLFGPVVAEYHLSATTKPGRRANATNLLLHGAACAAQQSGLRCLYLGGGTDADPDNALLRFKQSHATGGATFSYGHRIHDVVAYAELRAAFPEQAHAARRVLFYRG